MGLFKELEKVLKKNNKYISDDGSVLKTKVYEDCMNMDTELLSALFDND